MKHDDRTSTEAEQTHDNSTPVDVALDVAQDLAVDDRVRQYIRRARQRRVVLTDGGTDETALCSDCDATFDAADRWQYLPAGDDGEPGDSVRTLTLCPTCAVRRPSQRLFRPSDTVGEGSE